MNFDLGLADISKCHPKLAEATEHWTAGRPFDAYRAARRVLKEPADSTIQTSPEDWWFLYDVASVCSQYEASRIFASAGHRHFPNDSMLGLLHAWELAASGKFFEGGKILKAMGKTPEHPARVLAVSSYNFSIVGWRKSAEKTHEKARQNAGNDPFCWYILSRASARAANWLKSVEEAEKVVELAPKWTRARAGLSDSLNSIGRGEEAYRCVFDYEEPYPYSTLDLSRAMCAETAGESDRTIEHIELLMKRWPKSKLTRFAGYYYALLLIKNEQPEQAMQVVAKYGLKRLGDLDAQPTKQVFIPLPLVAQTHNHCVPTVAAMVAESQGVSAKPIDLANEMMTRHGTPMFRMIDHMRSQGFRCVCLKAEPEIIERMLDQEIPLIGTLVGLFGSHVEVICGYHKRLELFHVRDPMHWFGNSFKYETLSKRYHQSAGLWAMVAPDRESEIELPDAWIDEIGSAYVDLSRACVRGKLQQAEEAYAKIPDDHPLSLPRDQRGRAIVITGGAFQKKVVQLQQQIPENSEDVTLSDIQALMLGINDETADTVYELASSDQLKLGETFLKYIHVRCLIAKHQWPEAEKELKEIVKLSPGFDDAWQELSTVQSQLGKLEQAQQSLKVALDIAPDRESYQRRSVELDGGSLTFEQKLRPIQKLIKNSPDHPEHYADLASVLSESSNGAEYEKALKRCIHFFPRAPSSYEELAGWYVLQSRTDLAKQVMSAGRKLIGEDELAIAVYEQDPEAISEKADPRVAELVEESPEAQASQTQFARLMKSIGERLKQLHREDSASGSSLDLAEWSEVQELQQLDSAGTLPWWESVYWRSAVIGQIISQGATGHTDRQCAEAVKKLLPEQVSGIPERYTDSLLQSIGQVPRLVAGELVGWVDRICSQRDRFASLEFSRAYLLECMGLFNEAEEQLNLIVQRHAAYGPAFYRLGQIAVSRGDFETGMKLYEKCLELSPGNHGSLRELIDINRYLQSDRELEFLERMYKLYPYSQTNLYELASAVGNKRGHQHALQRIDSASDFFGDSKRKLLASRYWADVKEFDNALTALNGVIPNEKDKLIADWIKVDCQIGKGNYRETLSTLRAMEQEHPNNADVSDQLARVLRELNPAEAKQFSRRKLLEGQPILQLAYICIQNENNPDRIAREIVEQTKPEVQELMVEAFGEALNRPEYFDGLIRYLKWAKDSYPQLTGLQATLVNRLTMMGKDDEAAVVAKGLLDRDPENPKFLNLYGVSIQDNNPAESIKYLKKEFELNGKSDALCRIARGYQLMKDEKNAKDHYFKALKLSPNDTLAITNLYHAYEVVTDELFDGACGAISQGQGVDDQYFLVVVVKMALKLKRKLPEQWYYVALERMKQALSEGGFRDEIPLLKKSIAAWEAVHKPEHGSFSFGTVDRLKAKWLWPRTGWVPTNMS